MAWVLSVDFGTSSTAAAMGRDGGAQLVGVDGGLPRMLSNVFWHDSRGQLLLGDVADNASATMPWCYEPCPKRKLGQEFLLLGDERVRVSDAVGAILQSVAQDATRMQGGERHKAVRLTHPVRWGTERRNALIEAAAVAGLDEPELVLEPVAAAMHYASERLQPGEHVAVYDLGGGTFDTAVLQRTDTGFQVVGVPGGRNGFGGEEFDDGVYRFLGAQLPEEDWLRLRSKPETDDDTAWPKANRHFQRNVRRAKELLTKTSQVDVLVPSPVNRELVLRTDDLNALIRTDVEDSVAELERTIRSAGLEPEQLAAIYLAGGSSQIPLVTSTITERLGIAPTYLNDPKAVICLGAALGFRQAAKNGAHASRTDGGAAAAAIGSSTAAAAIESSTAAAAIESSTAAAAIESSRAPSAVATAVDLADTPPIAPIVEPRPKPVPEAEPEPAPTVVPLAEPEAMALAEPGPTAKVEAAPGRRTGLAIAGIVGALAVVIVGAFAVLSGGNSSNKAPISGPTHTEASGPVLIAYPSSWISGSAVAGSSAVGGGSASAAAPVQLVSGKLSLAAGQLKDSRAGPRGGSAGARRSLWASHLGVRCARGRRQRTAIHMGSRRAAVGGLRGSDCRRRRRDHLPGSVRGGRSRRVHRARAEREALGHPGAAARPGHRGGHRAEPAVGSSHRGSQFPARPSGLEPLGPCREGEAGRLCRDDGGGGDRCRFGAGPLPVADHGPPSRASEGSRGVQRARPSG